MNIAWAASRQPADSSGLTPSSRARSGIALRRVRGGHQVLLGHQVGVDVVVGQRAVLVRAGDPVDVEPPLGVVVAEGAPQPRGVGQQVYPRSPGEVLVPGQVDVADHRVGDVRVDVEGGGPGGPVARALLAGDRPPREGRAFQPELGGPLDSQRAACCAATAGRWRPRPGWSGSAPAARTSRCPRTRARRTRARSGPWPGSPGSPPGRPPAARGTARSAPPAGPRCPRPPPRRRGPRNRPGTHAARRPGRPSRSAWPRSAPPTPGRGRRAASASPTSRRPRT